MFQVVQKLSSIIKTISSLRYSSFIYIYIYIYRERERERGFGRREMDFVEAM